MIGNWELYGLSEAELHYVLADAHVEAALFLASGLRNATYPRTFSHAKVIMSLHHHAAELFLKYALSRAAESVPTHHHLRDLWHQYTNAYPDPEFAFQPPWRALERRPTLLAQGCRIWHRSGKRSKCRALSQELSA